MTPENIQNQIPTERKEATKQAENITLLPESSHVSIEEIVERFGNKQKVIVCDFYLDDIESRGEEEKYGLNYHSITNIDHHAPIAAMERPVSSAVLAIEHVNQFGSQKEATVVVNHTDCDSTLSSSIIRGTLPPEKKFADAAIAADHTGEPNDIADLLQSLDTLRDLDFSLRNLNLLLNGEEIEDEAKELLKKRLADRERAKSIVESGAFNFLGEVAYAETDAKFDSAFLSSLLPDSSVIMVSSPFKDKSGNIIPGLYEVAIRLGINPPKGMTLQTLGLKNTDIRVDGRWNAGRNKRNGGTHLTAKECAEIIQKKIDELNKSKFILSFIF